jgi:hypothetical protein
MLPNPASLHENEQAHESNSEYVDTPSEYVDTKEKNTSEM